VQIVDLRLSQLEISGQDILSEDKVQLRLNLFVQYKIDDPVKAYMETANFKEQFYVQVQLVLREYIGGMKLDEILHRKKEIGEYIINNIKETSASFGIKLSGAGIKDIILPGEIKDILNTVLLAEKKAQAAIITRREEIASTRSLLNTAKLMDENKTLYRLKELEFLEKISDKIGALNVGNPEGALQTLLNVIAPAKG
jgi:regulator of protease activity HflC (stomatin/prohibitin superfamily)